MALMRIANRVYPDFFRSFFFFFALGITLSSLWFVQWFFSPAALSVPNPFVNKYAFFTSVYFPLAFGLAVSLSIGMSDLLFNGRTSAFRQ
jgi:hypothetical protein